MFEVSGLFYFELMKFVVEKLKEVLDFCDIKDVSVLVILNVFVDVMIEKVEIKEKFIE